MRSPLEFFPPLKWWPEVTRSTLQADAWAALTAAIMVLPQAIAFAAIAGMPVQYGFYTAIVTPIFAALFGSSRHMISGPTTAISVLVFGSLSAEFQPGSAAFVQAAITLTLLAGLFQVVLGLLRLGSLSNFVSPSVMTGFTAGAAVIIFVSQLPSGLGFKIEDSETTFESFIVLAQQLGLTNPYSLGIASVSLVVAVLVAKFLPRLPNYLMALAAGTLLAYVLDADAHGVRYVESVSVFVPSFAAPEFSLDSIRGLAQSAFAVALVGLLEATAISRSLSIRSGHNVDVNQEFIGQGISNAAGSFFSTYMGSGSFTRSAMNYDAGAKTPISAILASIFLLLTLIFVGQWIVYIPVPAIAGIIMLVAYRLIEFHHIKHIISTSHPSSIVMVITFIATLVVGLEFGIVTGVFVSLALYLRRTSSTYLGVIAPDPTTDRRCFRNVEIFNLDECPQLAIARPEGELYFGSLEGIRRQLLQLETEHPGQGHLILLMKGVGSIDMPGAQLLIDEAKRRRDRGGQLYITARQRQIHGLFRRYGVMQAVGENNIYTHKSQAIETVVPKLDQSICATCDKRIFKECPPPQQSTLLSEEEVNIIK